MTLSLNLINKLTFNYNYYNNTCITFKNDFNNSFINCISYFIIK